MARVLDSMKFIIAELYKGDRKTSIGYRLADVRVDADKAEIKDVPTGGVVGAMQRGMVFENVALVGGKIVGIQGSIERLPKLVYGETKPFENNNMTIVNKMGDVGYKVMDFAGRIKKYRTEDAIALIDNGVFQDLTNGKIVERDGLKFISAINGEYRTQAIKETAKIRVTSKDVVVGQHRQEILNNTVKMENRVVQEEIDYNDTFKTLTEDQRRALEMYYTWWTTTTFNTLTNDSREALKANPKKVAALAELRGKDIEWKYSGTKLASLINPNGVEYCSLGHRLQIVHFAKGMDKEGRQYVIKFGSTCVADFFDIDPKAMTVLTKVTDTMKEEIERVTKFAENKELDSIRNKTRMVEDIYHAFGDSAEKMAPIFTPVLTKYIEMFIKSGLPIPESLLKMIRESWCVRLGVKLDDDLNEKVAYGFWTAVFGQLGLGVEKQNDLNEIWRHRSSYMNNMSLIEKLGFIPGLEGIYGYDPLTKTGHRGKGRFTAEAVRDRKYNLNKLQRFGCRAGVPSFKDVADAYVTLLVYNRLGKKINDMLDAKVDALVKLGYNEDTERRRIDEALARGMNDLRPDMNCTTDEFLACQALMIGYDIYKPFERYCSMIGASFPYISSYRYSGATTNKKFDIHSGKEIEKFAVSNAAKFNSIISDIINVRVEEHKAAKAQELEEKKKQEEFERQKKLQEMERKHRESIICTNMECKFNDDGTCKHIIEHGVDASKQEIGEYDTIRKCNLFNGKEENKPVEESKVTDLDLYLNYVNAMAQKDITVNNSYREIAHSISTKVTDDKDLSYKQRMVIKRATGVYRDELAKLGWILRGKELVRGELDKSAETNDKKSEIKDSENWVKQLRDVPDIAKEVEKVLEAASNGDDRLTTKIANIAFSVKKFGKISAKQYKNIKEGIERLK